MTTDVHEGILPVGIPANARLHPFRRKDSSHFTAVHRSVRAIEFPIVSKDRIAKERGMRRRQLKWLWRRLKQLSTMPLTREALLMKLGETQGKTPAAWRLVKIEISEKAPLIFELNRRKLREVRRREGRYLLPISPGPIRRRCGKATCNW